MTASEIGAAILIILSVLILLLAILGFGMHIKNKKLLREKTEDEDTTEKEPSPLKEDSEKKGDAVHFSRSGRRKKRETQDIKEIYINTDADKSAACCPFCGSVIYSESAFCQVCGTHFRVE